MVIQTLRLLSFRAHTDTSLALAPKLNVLYGPNGAGKTNVLEAVHYLCLTKSFVASKDTYALRNGAPFFELEGHFTSERGRDLTVRLVYVPSEGKRVFINRAPLERLSDIVGTLPAVTFSPEDQALTAGGPEERRRFIDNILSQARPVYLDDLLSYRRALRQRNELLMRYRKNGGAAQSLGPVLESWTEELIALGARLIAARLRFVEEFGAFLNQAFAALYPSTDEPGLEYVTVAPLSAAGEDASAETVFRKRLERAGRREREVGRTLAGPHLDELVFRLNGMEVRRYASQGQHRMFGMAMKLGQYLYLQDRLEEQPLLLLDDVFGNLDPTRTGILLDLLQTDTVGQSLITATHLEPFTERVQFGEGRNEALEIRQGALVHAAGL